eukprot:TRINITY_DN66047_c0_g1_i1.p1 TRINITY_DN66047_c0_g1~~TRINITY_DN66047_c0_g1_i1.p1  ORF type:complete len:228 (+),score=23.28 TRINITY_DN66047_c0_g1_i1:47-730(+)
MFEVRALPGRGNGIVSSKPISMHALILIEEPFFEHNLGQYRSSLDLAAAFVDVVDDIDIGTLSKMAKLSGGEALESVVCSRRCALSDGDVVSPDPSALVLSVYSVCQRNAFGGERPKEHESLEETDGVRAAEGSDSEHDVMTTSRRSKGSYLYETACLFNHSCDPNAQHKVNADGRIVVCARRGIAVGEEITIAYVSIDDACATRQEHLKTRYGFECTCTRCASDLP